MESQKHLVDYVWMIPPGGAGAPVKVPIEETATNMWQGWTQCAPPAEPKKKGE
jgi:hypothetical protein